MNGIEYVAPWSYGDHYLSLRQNALHSLSRDGEWLDCSVDMRRASQCGHSFNDCNRAHAVRKLAICRLYACDQGSIHAGVSI
jgi:hypothetical protein